ncbi:uncharacterized protein LOC126588484 isoform X2 [Malus sylvestris]|uniref:uncharacterized protein LOC126588484 isoform X2 n=1 Tax=Malus sylvestris TaxID=3752 RepID=UPI0021AC6ACF|nr:uncharacterized protein LOC126588484 isoform X2 [Malus sylvestris]
MKGFVFFDLLAVFVVFLLCGFAVGKECTNSPTQLSSHTYRYDLLSSHNETLKEEMFSHYHLIPTDDSAWMDLLPRKLLRDEDEIEWGMMYRKMKALGGFEASGDFLKEVPLHDVRLHPTSQHGRAQQTNLEYLLMLDSDSLIWSFRQTAGLSTPGTPYKGWEDPTCELRGHFVGHYLSATAQMWASTHNQTLKDKMSAIVDNLSLCQKKIGSGYLSAFPSEEFDRFEAVKPVWAPYYTIHKILAGLLDQYTFADNAQALKMVTWMVEYFYNRVQNVISKYSVERHYTALNEETGGMNDVLYKLYAITGDAKHLLLAHLFDKPCFLGVLAVQAEDISGFHANTHIPIVIGAQMRYEVTGDPLYKEMSSFFMNIVNSSHSYATGGTSVGEFWSDPKRLASTLKTENEESCTTYNMLKVSRHLFRWTKETAYADYYERALTNGVLGIQRGTEPGVMIYMLPLGRGTSKARSYHGWGKPFDSFWCCYGTGIESFSKLGDSIYFEEEKEAPALFIIQYISSFLDWKSGQIALNQTVDPANSRDPYLRVTLTFSSAEGTGISSTLNLRIPIWTDSTGAKAALNGQTLSVPAPGSFLTVTRKWSPGDVLTLQLPFSLRTEAIKDDRPEYASIQAILYGPYLLAAHTSGNWDIKTGSVRLVINYLSTKLSSANDVKGKSVMLELFDLPGKVVVQQGKDKNLGIADMSTSKDTSAFLLVPGLDGKNTTVSLESESNAGCYVCSETVKANAGLKLVCSSESSGAGFNQAASFVMNNGISQYHPISFVAKGTPRNFLLAPLSTFKDESYSAYLNIST